MKPKAYTYYAYIGGGLLAAAILAIAGWGPLAIADNSRNPVFAVDPFWPKPLPAPSGPMDFRILGYKVRSPETASTSHAP